jgi:hypothetical protein
MIETNAREPRDSAQDGEHDRVIQSAAPNLRVCRLEGARDLEKAPQASA